jgi:hypothetical protein
MSWLALEANPNSSLCVQGLNNMYPVVKPSMWPRFWLSLHTACLPIAGTAGGSLSTERQSNDGRSDAQNRVGQQYLVVGYEYMLQSRLASYFTIHKLLQYLHNYAYSDMYESMWRFRCGPPETCDPRQCRLCHRGIEILA